MGLDDIKPFQFPKGRSGFAGKHHSDHHKWNPDLWLRHLAQSKVPPKLQPLVDQVRVFFNYPVNWRPVHIELLQHLRLMEGYKQVAQGNFQYVEMVEGRLIGKPGPLVAIEQNINTDNSKKTATVIVLPSGVSLPQLQKQITAQRHDGDTDDDK